MGQSEKKSCCCGGIMAIVIAVLVLLDMHDWLGAEGMWDEIVVLVLTILVAIGAFAGCCCAKFCKPKEGQPGESC